MQACRICNNTSSNIQHIFKEVMYNSGLSFEYIECNKCGCLQIKEYPKNTNQFYPNDYYSFENNFIFSKSNIFLRYLRKKRYQNATGFKNTIGEFLSAKKGLPNFYDYLIFPKIKNTDYILDIGCGNGSLLNSLYNEGFTNLFGIDEFIQDQNLVSSPYIISRKRTSDFDNEFFDFAMMHHSLEHMPHQFTVLLDINRILKPEKYLLISIPIKNHAWEIYKDNWIQLDAPRHFYIHTEVSLRLLAEMTGFIIDKITYNSKDFQFWGSEQIKSGISLNAPNSYSISKNKSIFTKEEIQAFRHKSRVLNDTNKGDQAIFFLRKVCNTTL